MVLASGKFELSHTTLVNFLESPLPPKWCRSHFQGPRSTAVSTWEDFLCEVLVIWVALHEKIGKLAIPGQKHTL